MIANERMTIVDHFVFSPDGLFDDRIEAAE